jgi:iron-sulfur cluster assembly protein
MSSPTPQLVRIGVRNKGCAGLSYHLEYVDRPAKFDEVVEQDGVKVVIDSKALFSIIGSEMDWHEDALRCVMPHVTAQAKLIAQRCDSAQSLYSKTLMLQMLADVASRSQ